MKVRLLQGGLLKSKCAREGHEFGPPTLIRSMDSLDTYARRKCVRCGHVHEGIASSKDIGDFYANQRGMMHG